MSRSYHVICQRFLTWGPWTPRGSRRRALGVREHVFGNGGFLVVGSPAQNYTKNRSLDSSEQGFPNQKRQNFPRASPPRSPFLEFEGPRVSQLRIVLRIAPETAQNKVLRAKNVKIFRRLRRPRPPPCSGADLEPHRDRASFDQEGSTLITDRAP